YLLAGPVLAVTLPGSVGWGATVGFLLAWAGLGGVLAAVLVVLREQQRILRELGRREGPAPAAGIDERALRAALQRHGRAERAEQAAALEEATSLLAARLDHRILGLHRVLAQGGRATPDDVTEAGEAGTGAGR
ncbi:MAG: hypothetical protein ACLFUG_12345, partial [Nitriliruptoraceae bacterium]